MSKTLKEDARVTRDGNMFLFTFCSPAAKAWQKEHVQAEPWQWLGENLAVDHHFARDLVDGMQAAGLQFT